MPVLIIDFGTHSARAVVFTARKLELLESFETPKTDSLKEVYSSLCQKIRAAGFNNFSQVMVGLPSELISMRVITLPFSDKKKLNEILPFEASETFSKDIEELVLAPLPLTDGKVMAVAIEKNILREHLDILEESGIDPSWVGVSLFSKDRLLKKLHDGEGAAAFVDAESIVVIKDRKPYFFKAISDDMDLRLVLATLEEDGVEIMRFYSTEKPADILKAAGKDNIVLMSQYHDRDTGLLSLVAHLKEGLKDSINFCSGEFAHTKAIESAQKDFKLMMILLLIMAGIWGAYSYLRYQTLNVNMVQQKNRLGISYHELFPEETKVVDALHQLEIKLKDLQAEKKIVRGGANVLEIMRQLSEGGGKADKVRLVNLYIQANRVRINGETASFEGANNFKDAVVRFSYFKDAILTDVKTNAKGGVNFSLTFSASEG